MKRFFRVKKALTINPELSGAYNQLGFIYKAKDMLSESISTFWSAISVDTGHAETHNNLAIAYFLSKRYDLAVYYADKAVEFGFKVHAEFLKNLEPYR